jgi:hypothetical protein
MKALIRALVLAAITGMTPAIAQSPNFPASLPANTVVGRLGIAAGASEAIPFATFAKNLPLASGKIFIGNAGNLATPVTPSGNCTFSVSGVITCTGASGNFTIVGNLSVGGSIVDGNGILMTNIALPSAPAAGTTRVYADSTNRVLSSRNNSGTVSSTVVPSTAPSNQFATGLSAAGVIAYAQPSFANLSGSWTCAQAPALTGNVTTSAGSCATTIAALAVTNGMLAGSIVASKLVGTDIATVGTITAGTWQGTKVGLAYGGTNADLSATGGTSQFLKQATAGAAITVVQPSVSDLSGFGTGVATWLATPSSANLRAAMTDESGTGALIFAGGALGAATATSINGNTFTTGTYTVTGGAGKTFTFNNSLTFAGSDGSTLTFPSGSDTVVMLGASQTFTGVKHWGTGTLNLDGSSSGAVVLNAPAVAGSTTIVLPGANGTLATLDGTETLTNKSIVATQLTGTIAAARLPNPTSSTLGGVQSAAAVSNQWINSISTSGVPALSQPAFTNISGSVAASQLPNPSASTLGGIQSAAAVSNQWIASISTSGVPALSQPAFTNISGSVAASQLPNPSASTLGGIQSYAAVTNQWIRSISTSGVPASSQPAFTDVSGSVAATQMPALTGACTTSAGAVATTCLVNTFISMGMGGCGVITAGTTQYFGPAGCFSTSDPVVATPVSTAMTLKNFYVVSNTAPVGAQTYVVTVRKNNVDTAVTCTITGAATSCNDTTHTVAFAAGDRISAGVVSSASAVNANLNTMVTAVTTSP